MWNVLVFSERIYNSGTRPVILNLLNIDIIFQLPIILILMIPLTYVNYHVTKSILILLNFTENDLNNNEDVHKLLDFSKSKAINVSSLTVFQFTTSDI